VLARSKPHVMSAACLAGDTTRTRIAFSRSRPRVACIALPFIAFCSDGHATAATAHPALPAAAQLSARYRMSQRRQQPRPQQASRVAGWFEPPSPLGLRPVQAPQMSVTALRMAPQPLASDRRRLVARAWGSREGEASLPAVPSPQYRLGMAQRSRPAGSDWLEMAQQSRPAGSDWAVRFPWQAQAYQMELDLASPFVATTSAESRSSGQSWTASLKALSEGALASG